MVDNLPKGMRDYMLHHYRHFNSAELVRAAEAWVERLEAGDSFMLALAGALSSAEIGVSLAAMIKEGKIHAISCTGANLEEDVYNLIARDNYRELPNYRDLTAEDEKQLSEQGFSRVADTSIHDMKAMHRLNSVMAERWLKAIQEGERKPPHEYLYDVLLEGILEDDYCIDPAHSWVLAAAKKNLPLFVPGWEDSTLANFLVACEKNTDGGFVDVISSGLEIMSDLVDWYIEETAVNQVGFVQVGGGIAGHFPICVVPLINQDIMGKAPPWSYYCQISDSTTSYGSYSGAVPNEKISWGKLIPETPRFMIESDATIVLPLLFSYIMDD